MKKEFFLTNKITLPIIYILCSLLIFFTNSGKIILITKLPIILIMFFAVMIIIPINLIKIVSSNSFLIEEKKVRIISNILISATGSFILVLLFNTKGLTMNVASILSVLNCVFLVILLIKNNPKYKDVLFEHWLITSIFIGLIYFIK